MFVLLLVAAVSAFPYTQCTTDMVQAPQGCSLFPLAAPSVIGGDFTSTDYAEGQTCSWTIQSSRGAQVVPGAWSLAPFDIVTIAGIVYDASKVPTADLQIIGSPMQVTFTRGNSTSASSFKLCVTESCTFNCAQCYFPIPFATGFSLGNCANSGFLNHGNTCSLGGCPAGTAQTEDKSALTVTCYNGEWYWLNSPMTPRCQKPCAQGPLQPPVNFANPTNYTSGTCSAASASSGDTCRLDCVTGGTALASCFDGQWSVSTCRPDCQSFTSTGYLPGTCAIGKVGDVCVPTCNATAGYKAYSAVTATCAYFGISDWFPSGCSLVCTAPPPWVGANANLYKTATSSTGSPSLAVDGDITTSWTPTFNSPLQINLRNSYIVQEIRYFPTDTTEAFLQNAVWEGYNSTNFTWTLLSNVTAVPTAGWNVISLPTGLRGPWLYIRVTPDAVKVPGASIAEVNVFQINGNTTAGYCNGESLPGSSCSLACSLGSRSTTTAISTCDSSGNWYMTNNADCMSYAWKTGDWGTCTGRCASDTAKQIGIQTRAVWCAREEDGYIVSPLSEYLCTSSSRPTDTQSCTANCPEAPKITGVTPYNQSVQITFTYTNLTGTAVPGGNYVNSISFVSHPGNKVWTFSGPWLWNQGVLITGLDNGVEYQFEAWVETVYGDISGPGPNTPATTSAAPTALSQKVTPMASLGCYFTCLNGGLCVEGDCHCLPGTWSTVYPPSVALSRISQCDASSTVDLIDWAFDTNSHVITINYTLSSINPFQTPLTLLLLEEGCAGKADCGGYDYYRFTPSYVPNSLESTTLFGSGNWTVRLWQSNSSGGWDESPNILRWTYSTPSSCVGINCVHGICDNGFCDCMTGWGGLLCDAPMDACQQQGFNCGAYGNCTADAKCVCSQSYHGDRCEYPPECKKMCKNNGVPLAVAQTLGGFQCDRCICEGYWGGDDCGECKLQCNKGSPNKDCTRCICPDFYANDDCLSQYISMTVVVNGYIGMPGYYQVSGNIYRELTTMYSWNSGGVSIDYEYDTDNNPFVLTIKFFDNSVSTFGDYGSRLNARDMLIKDLRDPTSAIHDYYYSSFMRPETIQIQDPPKETPPSAGVSVESSFLVVAVLALAGLLL